MKIYLFEHHSTPYPVTGYGGGERVNELLFNTLTNLGIDVTLIIHYNSTFKAGSKVIQLPYSEIEDLWFGKTPLNKYITANEKVNFHSHTAGKNCNFDFSGLNYIWSSTCHGEWEDVLSPHQFYLCNNHAQFHIDKFGVNKIAKSINICNNGIDVDNLFIQDGPHNRLVWFGNICQSKGVHLLPMIAEAMKEKILIAGIIGDTEYFNQYVEPYIGENLEFVGELKSIEDKRKFLSCARAYLHTSVNQEPFGLTTVEAQSSGVPVVAFDCGSAREVLYDTDFLAKNVLEFTDKIKYLDSKKLSPQEIRIWTINRFSGISMTTQYLRAWNLINYL